MSVRLRAPLAGVLFVAGAALMGALGCSEGDLNPNDVANGGTSNGGSTSENGGSGNTTSNGGSTSSNGGTNSSGSGGSDGNGGPTQTFAFATGLDGFAVNYYCFAPPDVSEPGTNCVQVDTGTPPPPADAGADAGDAGVGDPGGPAPIDNEFVVLAHDPAEGSPDPGSARLTIQFQVAGQMAQLAFNTPNSDEGAINMSGKTLTAMVRADVAGATAKMYMKATGTYIYADSGQVQLVPGMWVPLTFVANSPSYMNAGYVATDIRELGISFETAVATLTPTTIHVDTIQY